MNAPEQHPPGVEHRIRLTVRDENVDALLARLTDTQTRHSLPGFLYVFSADAYFHNPDDYYDGYSQKEATLSGYRRLINDYNRSVFRLDDGIELEDRRLFLNVSLGLEAARRVIAPPFADSTGSDSLRVYYDIPGNEPVNEDAFGQLALLAERRPGGVFDELALVAGAAALRPIIIRSRERTDDILQI